MLDESVLENLRNLTIDLVLEVRAAYLATPAANALKHWDQIQDRLRIGARTTSSPEEWATFMARSLRLPAPSARYSESLLALTHEVHERRCALAWLDLLEAEYGYVMAAARALAERRKEARAAT
jgi:hypothetical protein